MWKEHWCLHNEFSEKMSVTELMLKLMYHPNVFVLPPWIHLKRGGDAGVPRVPTAGLFLNTRPLKYNFKDCGSRDGMKRPSRHVMSKRLWTCESKRDRSEVTGKQSCMNMSLWHWRSDMYLYLLFRKIAQQMNPSTLSLSDFLVVSNRNREVLNWVCVYIVPVCMCVCVCV